jgi:hypothetical protein
MVAQLQYLLKFGLLHWAINFVKEEGINLATMEKLYISIINCELLKIFKELYEGTCFGHVM